MAVTLQDLKDVFYDILREKEEDTSSYAPSLAKILINTAQQDICSWRIINPLIQWQEVRKWVLQFLNTDKFYANVVPTILTTTTTIWATSIVVWSTTYFASSWYLYIKWNIVTYSWKTSTSFTWCSNILFPFIAWTYIWQAFLLPTDFSNPINMIYNDYTKIDYKHYDNIFDEKLGNKDTDNSIRDTNALRDNSQGFYTIKDGSYLLICNINIIWWQMKLRYEKAPTEMTTNSSTCTIDNDIYAKSTIPYLAVWEMLYNRWEEERARELINFSIWKIRTMYDYYNNKWWEKLSWTKYTLPKSRFNI